MSFFLTKKWSSLMAEYQMHLLANRLILMRLVIVAQTIVMEVIVSLAVVDHKKSQNSNN